MNKNFKFISMVLTIVFCFSAIAFGQRTTGNIEGTITDPNGAVVPSATVTARSTGSTSGFNQTLTTDENGYFQFPQVPVGTYTITATGTGFKTARQEITVVLDRNANFSPKLEIGGNENVVDVLADTSVQIDQSDTKIDTNITKQIIEDLPAGVTFSSLLKIAPNVRPEPGGFQIDGASGAENVFIIDGQEVTNFRTGSLDSNFNIPFEIVQEVQIKSTGYEAEYGGATGGIINVVTSGGNDKFRGNFGASFKPGKLQGDRRTVLNSFAVNGTSNLPGNFEQFQPPSDGGTDFFPVASISGPIVKGKLWFSTTYAPQIFQTTRTIDYFGNSSDSQGNPSNPTGRFTNDRIRYDQNLRQEDAFVRLDAQPISRLRLFGTFLYNPIVQEGVLPASTEGLSGAPQSVNFGTVTNPRILTGSELLRQQGGRQNANAINGQATYNPTNYLVLNFRAGRSFLNEKLNSYGLPRQLRTICSQVSGTGVTTAATGCSQGFQTVGNNSQVNLDVSTRTTFDADASLIGINLGGRHNFKFGYQLNKLFNTVDRGYRDLGIVQLFYGRAIDTLAPVAPTGSQCAVGVTTGCNLGSGLLTRFGTVGEASSDNQGLFAQDSWTIGNRLTLNLGVRVEKEVVPNFGSTGSNAIEFNWLDKVSPRIGVAFDLTGDGKTKVFANYGIFYDRFKYELPRGSFGGDFFRRDYFEILPSRGLNFQNYTLGAITGGAPDPIGGTCPIVGGPGFSRCQFDFRIATNLAGADIFETGAIDPDIKAARQSEYTFGLERSLGTNFVLAARYTHKQVDRAIEDVGVFNDQGSEAYIIGNPGFGLVADIAATSGFPSAKAERKYDAFEVRVDKRANRYFFNASYTLSRLFGNYSGLASTDEGGRTSPNVNRFFDLPPLGFTADGVPDNGRLATDRPHVFKAYGGYNFNWGGSNVNRTTVSAFTTVQSGTPLTTIYNLYNLGTTVLFGRGDLGRTELFTETDFSIAHRYKFGRDARFGFEPYVDIRNLFNEANVLSLNANINGTNFTGSTSRTGGTASAANPNAGNFSSPLILGGCPVSVCGTELGVFNRIFSGGGISQFVLNYINNNNIGTTVTPFGAAAGSLVQTPQASRIASSYQQPNGFQFGRDVRFGARFFF